MTLKSIQNIRNFTYVDAKDSLRDIKPKTSDELRSWVLKYTGIKIAERSVCVGHNAPWEFFRDFFLDRPSLALVLGPRGGGKSGTARGFSAAAWHSPNKSTGHCATRSITAIRRPAVTRPRSAASSRERRFTGTGRRFRSSRRRAGASEARTSRH